MTILIWIGAALALLGLVGLLWCIRRAAQLRNANLEDDAARAEMQRLIFAHMASMGGAFLGIGLAVAGLLLGP